MYDYSNINCGDDAPQSSYKITAVLFVVQAMGIAVLKNA